MDSNIREKQLEQKLLLAKVEDKIQECINKNKITATAFLDMAEQEKIKKYLQTQANKNICFCLAGGYENAQRRIVMIYPEKIKAYVTKEKIEENFLTCLRIKLPKEQQGIYVHKNYLRRSYEVRD